MSYLERFRERRRLRRARLRRQRLVRAFQWYLYTRPFRLSPRRRHALDRVPPPPEIL